MSTYKIEACKTKEIDGISYSTDICRKVKINFASAQYSVKMGEKEIELIPDRFDFLHEVTDIFPLSDYKIEIKQYLFRKVDSYVTLSLTIYDRRTGKEVFIPDSAMLSDDDYDYMRNVLKKALPQYNWLSAKERIIKSMKACLFEDGTEDILTSKAMEYLEGLVCKKYDQFKTEGYVDFDYDGMHDEARRILETVLERAYNATL